MNAMNATESNVTESTSGTEQTASRTSEELISAEITNTVTQFPVDDILQRLKAFAKTLKQQARTSRERTSDVALPTVGIIGMGRCGTNIAIDLANLVYEQRKIGIKELSRRGVAMAKRQSSAGRTSESSRT
jgi:phosphoglycerate dehydrogenase-like enzyme